MIKVIISGSTGFIGSAFVRYLLDKDIQVLALGRNQVDTTVLASIRNKYENLTYLEIDMENIAELPEKINEINWNIGDSCMFYNFAWEGKESLSDGIFNDQLKNVKYSSNAVIAASEMGCKKFINIGSQEELFIETYLKDDKWREVPYHSNMGVYATSKLASKDMCMLLSYLYKIDYVHIRFSAIIDENNLNSGYIGSVFNKIMNLEEHEIPKNKELFDLILISDAVEAFYQIALKGKNKDEFFIGTGKPKTLKQYFNEFSSYVNNDTENSYLHNYNDNFILDEGNFSIEKLKQITGFKPSKSIYSKLLNKN